MKKARVCLYASGLAVVLGGCQYLPEQMGMTEPEEPEPPAQACHEVEPSFEDNACLLPSWVAFGLESQRGDSQWRRDTLDELSNDYSRSEAERELARAVALAWGSERQWREASELYQTHAPAAPADLQLLLRYWRNEVEGRRSLARQSADASARVAALQQENSELSEKLEALSAIEQNMNLRQQSP
ncbi:hypothetical protein [Billgrantia kenyensis]|uniref:YfhG lipoprotein n=1 Tax=Billgrantia kenyensis TaxID=321266 RepID=A0A7W0AEY6_9GAMM|nr:hypothetical protein [Halomonas kenyensis]MBA2780653.1 hypothetical protein [Halomonas kenyensis]MCG6661201.1 hypothetical protein [Halomonas kenyensis]